MSKSCLPDAIDEGSDVSSNAGFEAMIVIFLDVSVPLLCAVPVTAKVV